MLSPFGMWYVVHANEKCRWPFTTRLRRTTTLFKLYWKLWTSSLNACLRIEPMDQLACGGLAQLRDALIARSNLLPNQS